jgi:phosphomethylpyrimidine synthase
MKITQDVRDFATSLGVDEGTAIEVGMKRKSDEFREAGAEIYRAE